MNFYPHFTNEEGYEEAFSKFQNLFVTYSQAIRSGDFKGPPEAQRPSDFPSKLPPLFLENVCNVTLGTSTLWLRL